MNARRFAPVTQPSGGRFFPLLRGRLDDRVRAREYQARVTVIETHQVWRLPARSADFDDLADPL
jgi:hypothetical protein